VLVSLGGMDYPIPFERWPRVADTVYISGKPTDAAQVITVEQTGLNHLDILASCDALITKPGYGMFTEAACAGRPLLYLPRGDWPEEPWLIAWQQEHGFCQPITDQQLREGDFAASLQQALQSQPLRLARPSGVDTIVEGILAYGRQP
jgi:UDP-N-acetylglucosamine:LPS N-acetylglucosamine transferase